MSVVTTVTKINSDIAKTLEVLPLATVIATGITGPAGPAGASGFVIAAAVAIGGNRVVYSDANYEARYADRTDINTCETIIGVTEGAAGIGGNLMVTRSGVMDEPSWSWAPGGLVYLGVAGGLTQVAPTSGILVVIGAAINATKLLIDIQQRLILE